MNTETPTTAAELLREYNAWLMDADAYEIFGCATDQERLELEAVKAKMTIIAARLDERITDAGVSLENKCMPVFEHYYYGKARDKNGDPILAEDLIIYLQWLLIKENHGK